MGVNAIELKEVSAAYAGADRPAISGVSLTLKRGELGVMVGPNGAGKTTILEVILGLLAYQAGSVKVLGEEVREAGAQLRRRLAYLPQDLFFPPDTPYLTRDVVVMGRFGLYRPWRRLPRQEKELALSALATFGLPTGRAGPSGICQAASKGRPCSPALSPRAARSFFWTSRSPPLILSPGRTWPGRCLPSGTGG